MDIILDIMKHRVEKSNEYKEDESKKVLNLIFGAMDVDLYLII